MTKVRVLMAAFIFSAGLTPAYAVDQATGTAPHVAVSTTPFIPSASLSPGRYGVAVTPDFNASMGKRLQEAVGKIPGVSDVSPKVNRSVLMFTIKESTSQVHMTDIQKVVAKTYANASITTPVLEGTMSPSPGL